MRFMSNQAEPSDEQFLYLFWDDQIKCVYDINSQ
jgi:hypothetical protein